MSCHNIHCNPIFCSLSDGEQKHYCYPWCLTYRLKTRNHTTKYLSPYRCAWDNISRECYPVCLAYIVTNPVNILSPYMCIWGDHFDCACNIFWRFNTWISVCCVFMNEHDGQWCAPCCGWLKSAYPEEATKPLNSFRYYYVGPGCICDKLIHPICVCGYPCIRKMSQKISLKEGLAQKVTVNPYTFSNPTQDAICNVPETVEITTFKNVCCPHRVYPTRGKHILSIEAWQIQAHQLILQNITNSTTLIPELCDTAAKFAGPEPQTIK